MLADLSPEKPGWKGLDARIRKRQGLKESQLNGHFFIKCVRNPTPWQPLCSLYTEGAEVAQAVKPLLSPAYMGTWGLGQRAKWDAVQGCHTPEASRRHEGKTERERKTGKGSETQRPEIESRGARLPSRRVSQARHLLRALQAASSPFPSPVGFPGLQEGEGMPSDEAESGLWLISTFQSKTHTSRRVIKAH